MTSEIVPGIYERGIIKLSKKLDITGKREVLIVFKEKRKESIMDLIVRKITGKREVLIIFKEKRKESMVDLIVKKIRPVEDKVIDEAIELTEQQ